MLAAKNIETTNSNSQMLSRWSKGKFHDFSLLFTLEDVFDGRLGLALEVDLIDPLQATPFRDFAFQSLQST